MYKINPKVVLFTLLLLPISLEAKNSDQKKSHTTACMCGQTLEKDSMRVEVEVDPKRITSSGVGGTDAEALQNATDRALQISEYIDKLSSQFVCPGCPKPDEEGCEKDPQDIQLEEGEIVEVNPKDRVCEGVSIIPASADDPIIIARMCTTDFYTRFDPNTYKLVISAKPSCTSCEKITNLTPAEAGE